MGLTRRSLCAGVMINAYRPWSRPRTPDPFDILMAQQRALYAAEHGLYHHEQSQPQPQQEQEDSGDYDRDRGRTSLPPIVNSPAGGNATPSSSAKYPKQRVG
eukprot:scaffold12725_cov179-Ochromonas_danica.AAC.1